MNVIAKRTLKKFYLEHSNAKGPLEDWFKICVNSDWKSFSEIKSAINSVDLVGNRLVFNIGGNNFRVVCGISYKGRAMFIKWVGTHAEYDRLDVETL